MPRARRVTLPSSAERKPRPRGGARVADRPVRPSPPTGPSRRRPYTLAGLVAAGIVTVAASAPPIASTGVVSASADGAVVASQEQVLHSAPSLEQHIEERREESVSRSTSREALPEPGDDIVPGTAKATAEPEPEDEDDAARTSGSGDGTSSSVSGKPCSHGSDIESGLTSNAIAVYRAVCAQFPGVSSYGGLRSGDGGAHGSGRAVDIMVSGSLGDQVADYVRANASRLGVTEVIWAQKIWTTQRGSEGWRPMSNRGSATANHYDHVHVTVR